MVALLGKFGGLTPEVLAQVDPNRRSGILAEHPERVLVMGMIYFGCLGLAELWLGLRPKCSAALRVCSQIDQEDYS